jgi:tripartite-type tricarboxylate transporter receptor subunit TctC
MNLPRRRFLHLAVGAAALLALPRIARAQAYPTRPVRLISGFPAGGPNDLVARLMGHWLSDRLSQPFIVENRPGAGGNIAAEAVAKSPPDGHTLLMISTASAINATLYERPPFNFIHDIAPVARIGRVAQVMVVNPSFPAQTLIEFIAYAKANPRRVNFASAGNGSLTHVAGALFDLLAGTQSVHVPYRGEAPAVTDLLAGQVQVMFPSITVSLPHIRAGTLRPLGVTTAARLDALPDVPALAEFVMDYEATAWHGIGAPRNTPAEIVDKLNREVNAALADPNIKARLADVVYEPVPMTRDAFGEFIAEEIEKWGKVVRLANIKPV